MKLLLAVVAIVVPIAAGFALAGPGFGTITAGVAAVAIVVVALRMKTEHPIGPSGDADGKARLLVVISHALEDDHAVERIAELAQEHEGTEVMVLASAKAGFIATWADDLSDVHRQAQEDLVITVASLARFGIEAEARVGDLDLVQAVEDQLGTFPATELVLVTGPDDVDERGAAAAEQLGKRLTVHMLHLVVSG